MSVKVVKFGGSSLADAEQFRKVESIIRQDPARCFVVASAPGKRSNTDTKVTDLLYRCYDAAVSGEDFEPLLTRIRDRFQGIIDDLGLSFDLEREIGKIRTHLQGTPNRDYMASRGEYINSKVLAAYLDFAFVNPAKGFVLFREDGSFDAETTNERLREHLSKLDNAVIAGFYGAYADGTVHTFSRGGSDITGSIVARAVSADVYENWTDVSGMLAADPRLVKNPRPISYISYQELRELSYMGASVMHEDAVFPCAKAGIPINIRNTNRPQDAGTMIMSKVPGGVELPVITGIAGKKGFSTIFVEKSMLNAEIGFCAKLLAILAEFGLSIEHMPTGIDTISVLVNTGELAGCREKVLQRIRDELNPDTLMVSDGYALIAVVGHGMTYNIGTSAKLFRACADGNVNIRMIDQGSSEIDIIIAIAEPDYERAIRVIYEAFL